jgi:hypothetical protein
VSLPLKLRNTWYVNLLENEEEEGDCIVKNIIERNWKKEDFENAKYMNE